MENKKLVLFPDNEKERHDLYQYYGSRLLLVLNKADENELLAAFTIGEGSLCDLPEVCNTGWSQRIADKIPNNLQSDSVTSFTTSQVTPMRRAIVRGAVAEKIYSKFYGDDRRHAGGVHSLAVIEQLLNEPWSLGYLPEEIGTNETEEYTSLVRSVFDETQLKTIFIEKCTNKALQESIRHSLRNLDHAKIEEFTKELTQFYKKACLETQDILIDPMDGMRKLYKEAEEANEIKDPGSRFDELKKIKAEIEKEYSVTPFSMQLKELTVLAKKLRSTAPQEMFRFNLSSNTPGKNPAQALKAYLEEKKLIGKRSADGKEICNADDIDLLDRLCDTYTNEHKKDLYNDLTRCDALIIDQNASMFSELLITRDPLNGTISAFSDFGVQMCLASSGVIVPEASEETSSLLCRASTLLRATSAAAANHAYECAEKINDPQKILSVLPKSSNFLLRAPDSLLEDPAFMLEAIRINAQSLKFSKCTDENFIEEVLKSSNEESIPDIYTHLPEDQKKETGIIEKCIEKCSEKNIIQFYTALLNDLQKETGIIEKCIEKCDGKLIQYLYTALSEDLQKEISVIEKCIEKCPKSGIPNLYIALPEDRKNETSIIEKCIEKCLKSDIPSLYKTLPEDRLEETGIIEKCIEKCLKSDIPNLYKTLPEDQQKETGIIEKCIEKCSVFGVSSLYESLPEDLKKETSIIEKCIEKHDGQVIQYLYTALPEDRQKEASIIEKCIEKCSDINLIKLYETLNLPDDQQKKTSIIEKCIEKCSAFLVHTLYEILPKGLQKETGIIEKCIQKCDESGISELYKTLPEDHQKEASIIEKCIEKCSEYGVSDLYKTLPDDQKKETNIIEKCLGKCAEKHIVQLYTALPEDQKKETSVIDYCIEKCEETKTVQLYTALPEDHQKETHIIEKCIEKCSGRSVVQLYTALFEDQKKETNIIEKCLEKCIKRNIVRLYKVLLEDLQQETAITEKFIQKCEEAFIFELYTALPNDQKKETSIIEHCLEKCRDNESTLLKLRSAYEVLK